MWLILPVLQAAVDAELREIRRSLEESGQDQASRGSVWPKRYLFFVYDLALNLRSWSGPFCLLFFPVIGNLDNEWALAIDSLSKHHRFQKAKIGQQACILSAIEIGKEFKACLVEARE